MESRYEIRGEIGQGGVGIVYEAWDRQLARAVALKRLLPLDLEQEEERQKNRSAINDLLREASILSSMQHPNIVTVFDAGVDELGSFVVMELIDGEVLRDAIERGPLMVEDFVQVVEQTMDALVSAHHHGLLHRDIKPRNIMFRWLPSDAFQVKILDFGLAKFSPTPSKQTEAYKDTIMGSSAYMAPEQFEHLPLDYRTDIYSLGCVFYYSLTGTLPFDGDSPAEMMSSHLEHGVEHLHLRRPELPEALCDWVMWLINRHPDDRPASAKEALQSFREHVKAFGQQNSLLPFEEPPSVSPIKANGQEDEKTKPISYMIEGDTHEATSRSRQTALAGLALAMAVIGAMAFFLIPRGGEDALIEQDESFPAANTPGSPDTESHQETAGVKQD